MAASPTERECLLDPVLFLSRILGDDPWDKGIEIARAIEKPNARVAIRGCHSSSKTHTIALLVLWFVTRFKDGVVITTAPTDRQVEDVMWGEIRRACARSKFPFPKPNLKEIKLAEGNYAIGFTTNNREQGVRIAGYKAMHLMVVFDEAPGIPGEIMDAIRGTGAGGDLRLVLLGNPTIPGGPFYDAFTSKRELWTTITIDAYETPNFERLRELAGVNLEKITELLRALPIDHPALHYEPRPYLARPMWARELLQDWGETSPRWESRVRGRFPTQAEDALISLAWIEAAKNREAKDDKDGKLAVGIDVAGPGEDETVAIARCGPSIIASWASAAPETVAWNECQAFLTPFKPRIDEINIDSAGVGAGFAKQLEENGFSVNRVNVGEATRDPEQFYLLKAELYWGLRQRFKDGDVAGLTDETMTSQLATIRYKHNARRQVVIESKEEMLKRGVKSPDRAEALMLAFANRTPGIIEYYRDQIERVEAKAASRSIEDEAGVDDLTKVYEEARKELE